MPEASQNLSRPFSLMPAAYLWDPVMVTILAAPSWGILGGLGIIFLLLGRKKKPLIGYARS